MNPCDDDVFRHGVPVLIVDTGDVGGNALFDRWVVALAEAVGCAVDWHYSGGRAQVLTTGDHAAVLAMARTMPLPKDPRGEPMTVLRWCDDKAGIWRNFEGGAP